MRTNPIQYMKRLRAAARVIKGDPVLFGVSSFDELLAGPEDKVIQAKGVDGYWQMYWTDAEVSSSVDTGIHLALPGISVVPGGNDAIDKRNADLITAVLDDMTGSTLDAFQRGLLNASVTGFSVIEPVFKNAMIPVLGTIAGLEGFYTRPSESFADGVINGIETDRYGRIVMFRQSGEYGGAEATPDQVVYYAHNGGPDQRFGTSMLRSVYEAWAAKIKTRRVYQVFMVTNASGLRHAKLPRADFDNPTKRAAAQGLMEKLGTLASFTTPADWQMEVLQPGAGTGGHFREMLDMLNAEIRRGILGDSSFSAQEDAGGSYASRGISQQNVRTKFHTLGRSYCEAVAEQLFPMILKANGYTTGRVPLLQPVAVLSGDDARAAALTSLAELRQSGVLSRDLPEQTQVELMNAVLRPMDVEVVILETKPVPEPKTEPEPVAAAERKHRHIKAVDGKARKRAKDDAKALDTAIAEATADLTATWDALVPELVANISGKLFEQRTGGGWKVTDLTAIRQIVVEAARYKSSEIRKSITASYEKARELGLSSAKAILGVKASASYGWTPAQARAALQNRVLLLLEDKYSKLASDLYYVVEAALTGNAPVAVAQQQIMQVFNYSPYGQQYAGTILDTAMATAWNAARYEQFGLLENASGTSSVDIVGYQFVAVIDEHTTEQCEELNGEYYSADDPSAPWPPLHYNCRSQMVPVFGDQREGIEWMSPEDSAAQRAEMVADGRIQQGFGGR